MDSKERERRRAKRHDRLKEHSELRRRALGAIGKHGNAIATGGGLASFRTLPQQLTRELDTHLGGLARSAEIARAIGKVTRVVDTVTDVTTRPFGRLTPSHVEQLHQLQTEAVERVGVRGTTPVSRKDETDASVRASTYLQTTLVAMGVGARDGGAAAAANALHSSLHALMTAVEGVGNSDEHVPPDPADDQSPLPLETSVHDRGFSVRTASAEIGLDVDRGIELRMPDAHLELRPEGVRGVITTSVGTIGVQEGAIHARVATPSVALHVDHTGARLDVKTQLGTVSEAASLPPVKPHGATAVARGPTPTTHSAPSARPQPAVREPVRANRAASPKPAPQSHVQAAFTPVVPAARTFVEGLATVARAWPAASRTTSAGAHAAVRDPSLEKPPLRTLATRPAAAGESATIHVRAPSSAVSSGARQIVRPPPKSLESPSHSTEITQPNVTIESRTQSASTPPLERPDLAPSPQSTTASPTITRSHPTPATTTSTPRTVPPPARPIVVPRPPLVAPHISIPAITAPAVAAPLLSRSGAATPTQRPPLTQISPLAPPHVSTPTIEQRAAPSATEPKVREIQAPSAPEIPNVAAGGTAAEIPNPIGLVARTVDLSADRSHAASSISESVAARVHVPAAGAWQHAVQVAPLQPALRRQVQTISTPASHDVVARATTTGHTTIEHVAVATSDIERSSLAHTRALAEDASAHSGALGHSPMPTVVADHATDVLGRSDHAVTALASALARRPSSRLPQVSRPPRGLDARDGRDAPDMSRVSSLQLMHPLPAVPLDQATGARAATDQGLSQIQSHGDQIRATPAPDFDVPFSPIAEDPELATSDPALASVPHPPSRGHAIAAIEQGIASHVHAQAPAQMQQVSSQLATQYEGQARETNATAAAHIDDASGRALTSQQQIHDRPSPVNPAQISSDVGALWETGQAQALDATTKMHATVAQSEVAAHGSSLVAHATRDSDLTQIGTVHRTAITTEQATFDLEHTQAQTQFQTKNTQAQVQMSLQQTQAHQETTQEIEKAHADHECHVSAARLNSQVDQGTARARHDQQVSSANQSSLAQEEGIRTSTDQHVQQQQQRMVGRTQQLHAEGVAQVNQHLTQGESNYHEEIAKGESQANAKQAEAEQAAAQKRAQASAQSNQGGVLGAVLNWVRDRVNSLLDAAKWLLEQARNAVIAIMENARRAALAVLDAARRAAQAALKAIKDQIQSVIKAVADAVRSLIAAAATLIRAVIQTLANDLKALVQALTTVLVALVAVLQQVVHALLDGLIAVVAIFNQDLARKLDAATQGFRQALDQACDALKQTIERAGAILERGIQAAADLAIKAVDRVEQTLDAAITVIETALHAAVDAAYHLAAAAIDQAFDLAKAAVNNVFAVAEAAVNLYVDSQLAALDLVKKAANKAFDAAVALADKALEAISKAAAWVVSKLPDSFIQGFMDFWNGPWRSTIIIGLAVLAAVAFTVVTGGAGGPLAVMLVAGLIGGTLTGGAYLAGEAISRQGAIHLAQKGNGLYVPNYGYVPLGPDGKPDVSKVPKDKLQDIQKDLDWSMSNFKTSGDGLQMQKGPDGKLRPVQKSDRDIGNAALQEGIKGFGEGFVAAAAAAGGGVFGGLISKASWLTKLGPVGERILAPLLSHAVEGVWQIASNSVSGAWDAGFQAIADGKSPMEAFGAAGQAWLEGVKDPGQLGMTLLSMVPLGKPIEKLLSGSGFGKSVARSVVNTLFETGKQTVGQAGGNFMATFVAAVHDGKSPADAMALAKQKAADDLDPSKIAFNLVQTHAMGMTHTLFARDHGATPHGASPDRDTSSSHAPGEPLHDGSPTKATATTSSTHGDPELQPTSSAGAHDPEATQPRLTPAHDPEATQPKPPHDPEASQPPSTAAHDPATLAATFDPEATQPRIKSSYDPAPDATHPKAIHDPEATQPRTIRDPDATQPLPHLTADPEATQPLTHRDPMATNPTLAMDPEAQVPTEPLRGGVPGQPAAPRQIQPVLHEVLSGPRPVFDDLPQLRSMPSLAPEVMLGNHDLARIEPALQGLSESDYRAVGDLLDLHPDPVAQAFLLKAVISGNSISEVHWLSDQIREHDTNWLIDNLTLGDPRGVGGGIQQQWSMSCNAAMAITVRGNADPVFALRVREGGQPFQADLEKQLLESPYGGARQNHRGRRGVASNEPGRGVGRPADDLLNQMPSKLGVMYAPESAPTGDRVVAVLEDKLSQGLQVPIVVGNDLQPNAHYVVVEGRRVVGDVIQYSIHDPGTGQTRWVAADDIARGTIPDRFHRVGEIEIPEADATRLASNAPEQPPFEHRTPSHDDEPAPGARREDKQRQQRDEAPKPEATSEPEDLKGSHIGGPEGDLLDIVTQLKIKNRKARDKGLPEPYPDPEQTAKDRFSNLERVRERGYPNGFASKEEFQAALQGVRDALSRHGVNDGMLAVHGSSVHNTEPHDHDFALLLQPEAFDKLFEDFARQATHPKIKKLLEKGARKGIIQKTYFPRDGSGTTFAQKLFENFGENIQVSIVRAGSSRDIGPYLDEQGSDASLTLHPPLATNDATVKAKPAHQPDAPAQPRNLQNFEAALGDDQSLATYVRRFGTAKVDDAMGDLSPEFQARWASFKDSPLGKQLSEAHSVRGLSEPELHAYMSDPANHQSYLFMRARGLFDEPTRLRLNEVFMDHYNARILDRLTPENLSVYRANPEFRQRVEELRSKGVLDSTFEAQWERSNRDEQLQQRGTQDRVQHLREQARRWADMPVFQLRDELANPANQQALREMAGSGLYRYFTSGDLTRLADATDGYHPELAADLGLKRAKTPTDLWLDEQRKQQDDAAAHDQQEIDALFGPRPKKSPTGAFLDTLRRLVGPSERTVSFSPPEGATDDEIADWYAPKPSLDQRVQQIYDETPTGKRPNLERFYKKGTPEYKQALNAWERIKAANTPIIEAAEPEPEPEPSQEPEPAPTSDRSDEDRAPHHDDRRGPSSRPEREPHSTQDQPPARRPEDQEPEEPLQSGSPRATDDRSWWERQKDSYRSEEEPSVPEPERERSDMPLKPTKDASKPIKEPKPKRVRRSDEPHPSDIRNDPTWDGDDGPTEYVDDGRDYTELYNSLEGGNRRNRPSPQYKPAVQRKPLENPWTRERPGRGGQIEPYSPPDRPPSVRSGKGNVERLPPLSKADQQRIARIRKEQQRRNPPFGSASHVPGSDFQGGHTPADRVRATEDARTALDGTAKRFPKQVKTIERAGDGYVVTRPDGSVFSLTIESRRLDDLANARYQVRPTSEGASLRDQAGVDPARRLRGHYIIEVSETLESRHVQRAIDHELAEIIGLQQRHASRRPVGLDNLRPGKVAAGDDLSPHDLGRIAELNDVASARDTHELHALIEHLGLRSGTEGADRRSKQIDKLLTSEARALLDEHRRPADQLDENSRLELASVIDRARQEASPVANHDAFVEQLAHSMYQPDIDPDFLEVNGYVALPVTQGKHELVMRTFVPTEVGKPPIIAFRGTVAWKPATVFADLDPRGVGMYQFDANRELIETAMRVASNGGPIVVTGHSLGGALAQTTAATFPDRVARIVTFQSPGVSRDTAATVEEYNAANPDRAITSSHHRVEGDLIPLAGQALTPGTIQEHAMTDGSSLRRNPLTKHLAQPLSQELRAKGTLLPIHGDRAMVNTNEMPVQNAETISFIERARVSIGSVAYGVRERLGRVGLSSSYSAVPIETRAQPPTPVLFEGKAYDVMGVNADGELMLRRTRARDAEIGERIELNVPLEPGARFEARKRGYELGGIYQIEVGLNGELIGTGYNRAGQLETIDLDPYDIAPHEGSLDREPEQPNS